MKKEELLKVMPYAKDRIDKFLPHLNEGLKKFSITNIDEVRMLIAQLAVESAEFRYVKELASGQAYDTGRKAEQLGNTPEADGDGQRYKGRGLIQITGKRNYTLVGFALEIDCVNHPELLEEPKWAVYSALWYWSNGRLGRYSKPTEENFKKVTKLINGGYNHLKERMEYWERAKKYLTEV